MTRDFAPADRRDEAEAVAPAPAPRAPDTRGPAAILALQRGFGNAAVSRALLARQQQPPAAAVDTPETSYDDAITRADWEQAVHAFAAMDSGPRQHRLDSASTEVLLRVSQAAERLANEEVRNAFGAKLKEPKHAAAAAAILRDEEFQAARGAPDWPRMVRALAAYDENGMEQKLDLLKLETELNPLSEAGKLQLPAMAKVSGAIEKVRVRKLGEAYADAWQKGLWERAVELVQAYNNVDLPKKIEEIDDLDKISALTAQAAKMAAYQRVFNFAEPIRVARLNKDYDAAVASSDWNKAAILLSVYNDTDLNDRIKKIQAAGNIDALDAAAVAQTPRIGTRVHRHISFLLNAPAAHTGTRADYTVVTPGIDKHTNKKDLDGGEVHARIDVGFRDGSRPAETGGFELEYKGAHAEKTHWLQFIHRIIKSERTGPPATTTFLDEAVTTTGGAGGYRLTTDPAKPVYNTDSATTASPFYHARGLTQRDPTKDTMLDLAMPLEKLVAKAFLGGADKVTSCANFSTYLVRDMEVLYRIDISQCWEFDRATHWNEPTKALIRTPAVKSEVTGGSRVGALDKAHRDRLVVQYPKFDYLP